MFGWGISGAGQNPPSGMTSSRSASATCTLHIGQGFYDSVTPNLRSAVTKPPRSQPEAPADDLLHDLGGTAEDRLPPAVGERPGHGKLTNVAVPAVQLHAPVD